MITLLTERYKNDLRGVLSCYDRIIITGTLPGVCYARGMTSYLYDHEIKIFDYANVFADPLRHRIRENAQMLAKAHGVTIGMLTTHICVKKTWSRKSWRNAAIIQV